MGRLKTLIADDSALYRKFIRSALEGADWIDVVGAVPNGRIAIERMEDSKPDLLILDMEMPEMDGIQTLREMKQRNLDCPTLVFSSLSKRGAEITLEALNLGARDFIAKPNGEGSGDDRGPVEKIQSVLVPKLEELFPSYLREQKNDVVATPDEAFQKVVWSLFSPRIVVIGSSTGGPTVIEKIFASLSVPLSCPIVIAQHMPPVFTASFADRLAKISGIAVTEAAHGDVLEKNHVYVAPGDYHLRLHGTSERTVISLDQGPLIHSVRPSVDPLFQTAADLFGPQCLGLVLTGMGFDGRDGAAEVKRRGGAIAIQNKESCVVFGMPGAVFQAGAFDRMADPEGIAEIINEKVGEGLAVRGCV
ncbi:MAG TPA: chemotaxis-specific protein-glutamate methyltransferase CheB [Bdellovibrionales bacterium]|nr:chemotaxis-specific protein-glutamate methyltransferase CheB [Bdellovibrionales bacterium]